MKARHGIAAEREAKKSGERLVFTKSAYVVLPVLGDQGRGQRKAYRNIHSEGYFVRVDGKPERG